MDPQDNSTRPGTDAAEENQLSDTELESVSGGARGPFPPVKDEENNSGGAGGPQVPPIPIIPPPANS